ncbi:glycosidase [Pedobacter sp. UYP30]|uniref:alpha-amylase family glycosyl hydrolase n=1 Tax=Pedobacter sp. UYP30 TaxID=1756400 RepID=UPI0033951FA0
MMKYIYNQKILRLLLSGLLIISLASCKKGGAESKPVVKPPVVVTPPPSYSDPAAYGTPFAGVPAQKDMVMYEVNIRSFSQQANFQGVINRLDSIKALGVNVIWLMPTFPVGVLKSVPPLGSPYAVKDYTAVNTEFGDLTSLRKLVDLAHEKNMAVIFDWVADHTSWDNDWIKNKSWYLQDAAGNIINPPGTNWADVAALNYNNADMKTAMLRALRYWIFTANIDGYRCDYADAVPDDFWQSTIANLNAIPNRKLIFLAEGNKKAQFGDGFQLNYAFDFYENLKGIFADKKTPSTLFATQTSEMNNVANGGTKLRYTTNHDKNNEDGSPATVYNNKFGSEAAFVLSSCLDGVPLLYNGQEVATDKLMSIFTKDPINWAVNPDVTAAYKKILSFRKTNEAVKTGTITPYYDADVVAFKKTLQGKSVLVLVNVHNKTVIFNIPEALKGSAWLDIDKKQFTLSDNVTLQPYEYKLLSEK